MKLLKEFVNTLGAVVATLVIGILVVAVGGGLFIALPVILAKLVHPMWLGITLAIVWFTLATTIFFMISERMTKHGRG